ncbi:MAG: NfeD family protein [bacterium]
MSTMFWLWAAAVVVFLILELMTPTLVFGCFTAASLAAGVYAWFAPEAYYWQIGIFIVVSLVLLPATRALAKKITKESPQKSNVDALVGQVALVTKAIDPDLGGQIKIQGETWRAWATKSIGEGTKVVVMRIEGAHLHVEPKNE